MESRVMMLTDQFDLILLHRRLLSALAKIIVHYA